MAGAEWSRWVFAAMFAALTLFYLIRLLASGPQARDRSVDVSRGVMSLGMVTMLVPGLDPLPRLVWQILFALAAGHVAVRLIRRKVRPALTPEPTLGKPHESHLLVGGLAMLYMVAVMPAGHAMAPGMDIAEMAAPGFALPVLSWGLAGYFLVFVVRLSARLAVPVSTLETAPAQGVVVSPHLLGSSEVVMGIGMSYLLMTMR